MYFQQLGRVRMPKPQLLQVKSQVRNSIVNRGTQNSTSELFTLYQLISMVAESPREGRYHEDEEEGHENQET
jgi:hypothetical protein